MSGQILTFPNYLSDPAFEYRKVTIRIIKAKNKTEGADTNFFELLEKGQEMATEFAQNVFNTTMGDYSPKEVLSKVNNAIQTSSNKIRGPIDVLYTLTLPLPNSFTDSHSHQWSTDKGVVTSITENLPSKVKEAVNGVGKVSAILYDMSNQRKPLLDPGYFQNYSGTEPRDFSLSFDLVPNNQQEALDMFMIIFLLRQYSLPSTAVSHALILAPHYFQLEFTNPYMNQMVNAVDVVLKNISIDYGADGHMQQTPDGMPKHIKLDLTFSERNMSTNALEAAI